jgi:hypothetical protein
MEFYCSRDCQRKAWPDHRKECVRDKLAKPTAEFEERVRSGDAERAANDIVESEPGYDKLIQHLGISTGAYSDTQVALGHGVQLGMRADGYWVQLEKKGDWVSLGQVVGLQATADKLDKLMRKHNKPIDGLASVHKLMSVVARVMGEIPGLKKKSDF